MSTQHETTYAAMRAVLEEIGVIGKTRQTSGSGDFKYAFRGYEELLEVVSPLCKEHGLLTPPVMDGPPIMTKYETGKGAVMHWAQVPVSIHFRATANPEDVIVAGPFWGEAADSGDKAASKAQTVAWREIMFKTFNVPTRGEEYDTEGGDEEKAAGQAPLEPAFDDEAIALAKANGWNDLSDLEQGWDGLKALCAMPGESGEWARAWAKGTTKGTLTAGFLAEMEVVVASGAKKDGDWKANYEPPEVPL